MQHAGLNSEAIQVACTMGPQCATMARMGGEKTSQWTVCLDKHIQATDATNCIMTLGWKMKVAQYHYNEDSCLQRLSPLVRKHPLETERVAGGSITAPHCFRNFRPLPLSELPER